MRTDGGIDAPRPPTRRLAKAALAWGLPWLGGMALRLANLPAQVLHGDELHAVRAALAQPLATILTTYQLNDNCIPLTAYIRGLIAAGVHPGEMGLRAPILLFAALFLAAAPPLLARRVGVAAAVVFAWLVALSPLLVFYGGLVRSYMPAVALTFLAALAFDAWLESGRRRWAVVYIVSAALAVWFHLLSGPIVAAPLLFAAVLRWRGAAAPPWRALGAVAAAAGAAIASFLLPARHSLLAVLASKQGGPPPGWEAWSATLTLQAGVGAPILVATFWLFALAGGVLLWRAHRRVAAYGLTLIGVHVGALLVLSPYQVRYPVVFDRYMLPVLPWLLLAVAYAATEPWRQAAAPAARDAASPPITALAGLVAGCLLLGLAIGGPLFDRELRRTSFAHHDDYALFCCARPALAVADVPPFYNALAPGAAQPPLVEYPWSSWVSWQSLYIYQRLHRRDVLIASDEDTVRDPRLGLRNAIEPQPAALLASRGAWLVVHLDADAEARRVVQPACAGRPLRSIRRPEIQRILRDQARRMIGRATAAWGPPDYGDATVVAWDLARLRGVAAQAMATASVPAASTMPATNPGGR